MSPTTAEALRLWLARHDVHELRGQRLQPYSIGKGLYRYQLDVPVTARILRATFAFLAIADGMKIDDLKRRHEHTAAYTTLLNQVARWRRPIRTRRGENRGPQRRGTVSKPTL